MSEQRLVWNGGFRFTGVDGAGNEVGIDTDAGAAGAKPADLLPIALAACTAHDLVNILRKQRQELTALEASITSEQDADAPRRFRRIEVRFVARGSVDPAKARKALALAEKSCSVSATLASSVALGISIEVASD